MSPSAVIVMPVNPVLVLSMGAAYVLGRSFWPRANVPMILLLGVVIAYFQGRLHPGSVPWRLTMPVWVHPEFRLGSIIGVGVPLFIVTMASQNLPGVSVLRVSGYAPPISRVIGWSGVANLVAAPFGGFALNLGAITAAFCTGPDAHPDLARRYWATVVAGVFYGLIGIFGGAIVSLFEAFPHELVLVVAGLALLGTIGSGLMAAVEGERYRESSVLAFFVVLSGVTFGGIGSAFWGVVVGLVVLGVRKLASREPRDSRSCAVKPRDPPGGRNPAAGSRCAGEKLK